MSDDEKARLAEIADETDNNVADNMGKHGFGGGTCSCISRAHKASETKINDKLFDALRVLLKTNGDPSGGIRIIYNKYMTEDQQKNFYSSYRYRYRTMSRKIIKRCGKKSKGDERRRRGKKLVNNITAMLRHQHHHRQKQRTHTHTHKHQH